MALFAVGNILFGRFEEHRLKAGAWSPPTSS
jgi:hypothetical protein